MADISEELLNKLNVQGVLSAKEFASMLLFEGDESQIKDLQRTFKKNFLDKFKRYLNDIKTEDIKAIFDPLNLSGLLKDKDSLRNELKEYKDDLRKFLRKAKADLEKEKTKKEEVDTENKSEPTKKTRNNKNQIKEQAEFATEKSTVIEFGDTTKKFFESIMKKASKENEKSLEKFSESIGKSIEESGGAGGGGGILDLIGGIIAGGLLLVFWKSHIRPFLEEKFDFMNKLKGTFNGIEKFVYTVLPKLALDLVGGVLRRMDAVVQIAKGGLVKLFSFGGKAAAEAGVAGAAKAGSAVAKAGAQVAGNAATRVGSEVAVEAGGKVAGAVASKTSGGLLGKLGGIFLKIARGIPLVGAIVSVGFALDRLDKGDNIGAAIDFIGAFGSLLELFPPTMPIGLGLSWGAIALNAFLDITSEGATDKEKNESKGKNIMKWITAPFKWIANLPWVKSIVNSGKGLIEFVDGVISGSTSGTITGLKTMQNSFLSPLADILLPIYESNTLTENKTGKKRFDWANIWKDFTSKMLKSILPDWIYNMVAPYIVGDGVSVQPIDKTKITTRGEVLEQRAITNKETDRLRSLKYNDKNKDKQRLEDIKKLEENIKTLDEIDADTAQQEGLMNMRGINKQSDNNSWPRSKAKAKVNDGEVDYTPKVNDGEVDYTPKLTVGNNLIASFNPDDSFKVIASKQGGDFEKMMSNLTDEFQNINKQLVDTISQGLNNISNIGGNSIVNVNNSSGGNQNAFTLNTDMILRTRKMYMDSARMV